MVMEKIKVAGRGGNRTHRTLFSKRSREKLGKHLGSSTQNCLGPLIYNIDKSKLLIKLPTKRIRLVITTYYTIKVYL